MCIKLKEKNKFFCTAAYSSSLLKFCIPNFHAESCFCFYCSVLQYPTAQAQDSFKFHNSRQICFHNFYQFMEAYLPKFIVTAPEFRIYCRILATSVHYFLYYFFFLIFAFLQTGNTVFKVFIVILQDVFHDELNNRS